MSVTVGEGLLVASLSIGYSMPVVVTVLALIASRARKTPPPLNILPLLSLIVLAVVYFSIIMLVGTGDQVTWLVTHLDAQGKPATQLVTTSVFSDMSPFIGVALISAVMSIMLYPAAGTSEYYRYRTVLFIGGVIFMPLFVVISVILRSPANLLDKAWLLAAAMVGFWASAAWLASSRTQGRHVSGLEIRPGLPFRPDLILPGGVNYVKGVIMTGVGMMIMFQESFTLPKWNWWGFVLAFWGIIAIIPLRGMYKMFFGRRRRFIGDLRGGGFLHGLAKGNLLFFGLLILLYGFLSAFMGVVPFVGLLPKGGMWAQALVIIAASYVVIVVLREGYKQRLREGAETVAQSLAKLLVLYLGTLLLLYGFITLFMGRWMVIHPVTNPTGLALGLGLFSSGLVLIIPMRHRALRNELDATLRVMVGVIADLSEGMRKPLMQKRIATLGVMEHRQRTAHVGHMLQGLEDLPEEKRMVMRKAMMELMADLPEEQRRGLMKSMDEAQSSRREATA
ncbi:MAG: hypothetical protein ACE5IB_00215 [Candidatus Geothermarchaeales archaeon]